MSVGKRLSSQRSPGDQFPGRPPLARRGTVRVAVAMILVLVGLCCIGSFANADPPPWSHAWMHGHRHWRAAYVARHGHRSSRGHGHGVGNGGIPPGHAGGHGGGHGVGNGGIPPGHAKRHPGKGRCPRCGGAAISAGGSPHAPVVIARRGRRSRSSTGHRHRRRVPGRGARSRHTVTSRERTEPTVAPPTGVAGVFASPVSPTPFPAVAKGTRPHHLAQTPRGRGLARRPDGHVRPVGPSSAPAQVLFRFVHSIPWWVWLIVAAALALAAIAGIRALRTSMLFRRQHQELAAVTAEALIDPLTGALNRRGFVEAAERELARARRYGRPFAVAYVDIRGLKAVNDTRGHLAGDKLIRQATELLQDSARADDVVGRLGGDEFALLLVEQGQKGASAVASRVLQALPARRADLGFDVPWDLTIGTAVFPEDGGDVDELLRAADRRLYKQRGITLR